MWSGAFNLGDKSLIPYVAVLRKGGCLNLLEIDYTDRKPQRVETEQQNLDLHSWLWGCFSADFLFFHFAVRSL